MRVCVSYYALDPIELDWVTGDSSKYSTSCLRNEGGPQRGQYRNYRVYSAREALDLIREKSELERYQPIDCNLREYVVCQDLINV